MASAGNTVWSVALPGDKAPLPSLYKEVSSIALGRQQDAVHVVTGTWTESVLVNHDGQPWIQSNATRKQRAQGFFLVPSAEVTYSLRERRARFSARQITSPLPRSVRPADSALEQFISQAVGSWEAAFTDEAAKRILDMIGDIKRDEAAAERATRAHRIRRQNHKQNEHEAFGVEHYTPPIRAALSADFTVHFGTDGRAKLAVKRARSKEHFGFDAEEILISARKIRWGDLELLHFLQFGFYEYSTNSPLRR